MKRILLSLSFLFLIGSATAQTATLTGSTQVPTSQNDSSLSPSSTTILNVDPNVVVIPDILFGIPLSIAEQINLLSKLTADEIKENLIFWMLIFFKLWSQKICHFSFILFYI